MLSCAKTTRCIHTYARMHKMANSVGWILGPAGINTKRCTGAQFCHFVGSAVKKYQAYSSFCFSFCCGPVFLPNYPLRLPTGIACSFPYRCRPLLTDPKGEGSSGALASGGRPTHPPTHPPTHIRKILLRGKTKLTEQTRNWRGYRKFFSGVRPTHPTYH